MGLSLALVIVALAVALALRPWRALRGAQLLHPWFASLVLMPWLWAAQRFMPGGVAVQLSGACLMVLMLGWPLAVPVLLAVGALAGLIAGMGWDEALALTVWLGLAPASLALLLGALLRRLTGERMFVYILGRAFIGTALCGFAASVLAQALGQGLPGVAPGLSLVAHWLMAWGDAIVTGMLAAVFVAFKPQWLATWSDNLYLKRPR